MLYFNSDFRDLKFDISNLLILLYIQEKTEISYKRKDQSSEIPSNNLIETSKSKTKYFKRTKYVLEWFIDRSRVAFQLNNAAYILKHKFKKYQVKIHDSQVTGVNQFKASKI